MCIGGETLYSNSVAGINVKAHFFYTIPVERDLCPHIKCLNKILFTKEPNMDVIRKWNESQIEILPP